MSTLTQRGKFLQQRCAEEVGYEFYEKEQFVCCGCKNLPLWVNVLMQGKTHHMCISMIYESHAYTILMMHSNR